MPSLRLHESETYEGGDRQLDDLAVAAAGRALVPASLLFGGPSFGRKGKPPGASTAGGTIVSVSTTSVRSTLSRLSTALFTTIVPTSESSRGPKPIFGPPATSGPEPIFGSPVVHGPKTLFGAGCAHLELVPVHATFSALTRERHVSDVSGYRTDSSISFHALRKALLHKAYYLV